MVFRGQDRGGMQEEEEEESFEAWIHGIVGMFSFHPRLTCLYLSKELVDARVKIDEENRIAVKRVTGSKFNAIINRN